MVAQFAEKLDAQQSVKRHEEEEEQCDIVNLLPRTPVKVKLVKTVASGTPLMLFILENLVDSRFRHGKLEENSDETDHN